MKLSDALSTYLDYLTREGSSSSHLYSVRLRLGRFVTGREEAAVAAITKEHIHNHFLDLKLIGLAEGTLAGYKSSHRAFWRYCKKKGWLKKNPSRILKTKLHSYDPRPRLRKAARPGRIKSVLDSLEGFAVHRGSQPRDVRDSLIVSLTIDSAARRGEIWNIKRGDAEESLHDGELTANGRTVYHVESHGKTGLVNIRFYDETANLLHRWLDFVPATSPYLFISLRTGQRIRRDYMGSAFLRICEYAGVPPFRFQSVRKATVTDAIELSGDQKVGQTYANHRTIRTTQEYYNDVRARHVDDIGAQLATRRRGHPGSALAVELFGKLE